MRRVRKRRAGIGMRQRFRPRHVGNIQDEEPVMPVADIEAIAHPQRMGNRLYVSYWHHGLFILDISDMARPKTLAHTNTSPAFAHPTHTCLPIPQPLKGRRIMVVADEDVAKLRPASPSFAWIYDITLEQLPVPIATFQVSGPDLHGSPQPPLSECAQPSQRFHATVIPFA